MPCVLNSNISQISLNSISKTNCNGNLCKGPSSKSFAGTDPALPSQPTHPTLVLMLMALHPDSTGPMRQVTCRPLPLPAAPGPAPGNAGGFRPLLLVVATRISITPIAVSQAKRPLAQTKKSLPPRPPMCQRSHAPRRAAN